MYDAVGRYMAKVYYLADTRWNIVIIHQNLGFEPNTILICISNFLATCSHPNKDHYQALHKSCVLKVKIAFYSAHLIMSSHH